MQVIDFASLALIAAFSAKRLLRDRPHCQRRSACSTGQALRLAGETAIVTAAFEGGSGRVRLGDSEWLARGPDIAVGERVRITGSEGSSLLVEPIVLLQDDAKSGDTDTALKT